MVERHRAAIRRHTLSRPLRLAFESGLVLPTATVFDYGCGHGDDMRHLRNQGVDVHGWDPHFQPDAPKQPSDLCYLGFVLNVIENAQERMDVLHEAWSLAKTVLLVSALVTVDARGSSGIAFEDGVITRIGTFQKYFDQQELSNLLRLVTQEEPIALSMGVFAVVRDPTLRTSFIARQVRSQRTRPPRFRTTELALLQRDRLEPLVAFYCEHGRWPMEEERLEYGEITSEIGGVGAASRALEAIEGQFLNDARDEVRRDLLLFSALGLVDPTIMAGVSPSLRRDLIAAFGSISKGKLAGQEQLRQLADIAGRRLLVKQSQVGKLMPEALYVHVSAIEELPLGLRLYESIARRLVGTGGEANLIKLHIDRPVVSYLYYPAFDGDPHPALAWSMVIDLQTFRINVTSYEASANPPILHRKELFVAESYPYREKFARLTRQETKWDLYDGCTGSIGNRQQWQRRLDVAGLDFRGHRLIRRKG